MVPPAFDLRESGVNPSCGDALMMYISFGEDGSIDAAAFDGEGCAISQAAADMLSEKAVGMTRDEVLGLRSEDIYDLLGVSVGPSREKCALLALNALQSAMKK